MRGIHYFVTRFGPASLRKVSFDQKYIDGRWGAFRAHPEAELARVVEKYCDHGHILTLGCGVAAVTGNLKPDAFASFQGVDLSPAAIAIARERENGKIFFEIGDMMQYKFTRRYQVILLSESVYYIPRRRMESELKHLQSGLAPEGVIIVTIAEARRYDWILDLIRGRFEIIEDGKFSGAERQLLVFR